ncbi:hypothetical protein M513_07569 [Trichuris suis]|uniref:Uncharacterized protein n=1 Tax=Trichuris suis TaxID=68888 RepID=A0A085M2S3_9BILA|nr:hypothetical protein M513_07569 [Trichuris suis]
MVSSDSSVGRAVDCSASAKKSIGRWFKSGSEDSNVIHGTSLKLADYHDLKSLENSDGGKRFGDVTECQKRTSRASARKELPYGMF